MISNNILAGLVIVVLVLSIVSVYSTMGSRPTTSITGMATGTTSVAVPAQVVISLPVNSVDFGTIGQGQTNDTTDNSPPPFLIQNDGTVKVNITINRDPSSTPLFNGTGGGDNTASFQFKNDKTSEGICAIKKCSVTSWTNVPGTTPLHSVCFLDFVDTCDTVETELLINVPTDEPAGIKSEALVFTASEA